MEETLRSAHRTLTRDGTLRCGRRTLRPEETLRFARRTLRPEDRSLFDFPRPALLEQALARVAQAGPALLVGPPGAGKTTLLLDTARALSARGWTPIYL